jgi:hypothetical protein
MQDCQRNKTQQTKTSVINPQSWMVEWSSQNRRMTNEVAILKLFTVNNTIMYMYIYI